MKRKNVIRLVEFFIIGIVFGLSEDIIAIKLTTGVSITLKTVGIALLVALPFAVFSELIVDRPDFWSKIFKRRPNK